MPQLTLKQLKAESDARYAEFNEAKAMVLAFIANYTLANQPAPAPPPPAPQDPNDPALFVMPFIDVHDPASVDAFIARGQWVSAHYVSVEKDFIYWRPLVVKDPPYFWQKLIGLHAGPQDAPLYGPYRKGA